MKTTIRPYQDSDLDDLLLAWERATKLAHPFLIETFLEQERYNIPNVYLPNANTWVVVDDCRVVGFMALIGNEVGALFVDPRCHGRGMGKALMDKARSLHKTLELDVFKKNSIGLSFYERYGFKQLNEKIHKDTGNQILRLLYES
ncbi:MAG: GNAT family N-acetyltransferase [Pseudomonadales bacterium]|nr:GNAT family N-acetyltransferase [Pseudomonadales bacterium]